MGTTVFAFLGSLEQAGPPDGFVALAQQAPGSFHPGLVPFLLHYGSDLHQSQMDTPAGFLLHYLSCESFSQGNT